MSRLDREKYIKGPLKYLRGIRKTTSTLKKWVTLDYGKSEDPDAGLGLDAEAFQTLHWKVGKWSQAHWGEKQAVSGFVELVPMKHLATNRQDHMPSPHYVFLPQFLGF